MVTEIIAQIVDAAATMLSTRPLSQHTQRPEPTRKTLVQNAVVSAKKTTRDSPSEVASTVASPSQDRLPTAAERETWRNVGAPKVPITRWQ